MGATRGKLKLLGRVRLEVCELEPLREMENREQLSKKKTLSVYVGMRDPVTSSG